MNRILVIGGTGNVGRHVVDQLAAAGAPFRVMTRNPDAAGLPPGLGISAAGLISGAPTTAGTYPVSISVSDTGTGIKPEHLQRIFDLYFTTKERGTGIGLSMVYRTIQIHDGEIEVQSTPGGGTTFRVLLPQA